VAFKASTSSKSKSKANKEASSEDKDVSDIDDEAMALLVCKMGKFMKKRGYGTRKRRDYMKDHVRLCFECKRPNHIAANYPYKNDNEEDEKKRKKDNKEKEKKITFKKKKKRSGHVVTWDSNCSNDSDDDDSSDDDKRSIRKALASIAIYNKSSLFDTPLTYLMAKPTKVKYDKNNDEYDSDDCRSDDEEYSKEELIDTCEQLSTGYEKKRNECKELLKKLKALEKSFGSFKHLISV
jgi:hypothetical protein